MSVGCVCGRPPRPGEAVVASGALRRLGLTAPVGALTGSSGDDAPIVGEYRATLFTDLGAGAIIRTTPRDPLSSLRVVARDYRDSTRVQALALSLLPAVDPNTLNVISPVAAASLRIRVLDRLAASSAITVGIAVASGSALIAVIALADTLSRRREIGRRRALGITRSGLLLLTAARALIPAGAGVTLAGSAGWLLVALLGTAPPADFVFGIAVSAIVGTALFTAVPAAIAARQDPVRILRTP